MSGMMPRGRRSSSGPIGELLERRFADDTVRGIVLTDALIGTFTHAHDLAANRCFLYHVIGGGTGDWDVPVGGMGAVSGAARGAPPRAAGAELVTGIEVTSMATDGERATVTTADGRNITAAQVFANVAPAVLDRLLGSSPDGAAAPEGAQVKINMLLSRLPQLRDAAVDPARAFAGTFHVNEGYGQLARAYRQAAAGIIPEPRRARSTAIR